MAARVYKDLIASHSPWNYDLSLTLQQSTSAYVQLSHVTTLDRVSIMRPFDEKELRLPLDPELIKELEWQEDMAKAILVRYGWIDR